MEESELERKVGVRLGSAGMASPSEDGKDEGVSDLTHVSLQRARTDEATAAGSRSEADDEDDEDYVPYVPLRQRRQLLVSARGLGRNEGRGWVFRSGMRGDSRSTG